MNKNKLIDIAFLLIVSLLTITWFKGDFLINRGDQLYSLSPKQDFVNTLYVWDNLRGTGLPVGGRVVSLFYRLFPLLTQIGFSLAATEKVLYYFIFSLAGLSVYLLVNSLGIKKSRLIGIAASLAYLFNFFPLLTFWNSFTLLAFFYASAPLLLALYIKLLATRQKRYFIAWLLVSATLFAPAAVNPGFVIVFLLLHFLYFIYYVISLSKKEALKAFILSFLLFTFYFLLNAWWLFPAIANVGQAFIASGAASFAGSEQIFQSMSLFTSLPNVFRFFGPWTFYSNYLGDPYFPWNKIYFNSFFMVLSFVAPLIAICALLKKKKNSQVLFFGLLFAIGLFLMKGGHSPFGFINKLIVLKIPYFAVFRNSYEKFGVVALIGYSVLFGFGMEYIYQIVRSRFNSKITGLSVVGVLCFLLFGIYMWPFWTGDLIYDGGKITPSARMKVPDYYYQAADWLKDQEGEFRILSLPHQDGAAYSWEHGYSGSDDPAVRIFQRPIVVSYNPQDDILLPYFSELLDVYENLNKGNQFNQVNMAGLTNIKYILVHDDVINNLNTPNWELHAEKLKENLSLNPNIKLEKSFDKLHFYKISNESFLPLFFTPQKTIFVAGGVDALPDILSFQDYLPQSAIHLSELNSYPDEIFAQGISSEYQKLQRWNQEKFFSPELVDSSLFQLIPTINLLEKTYQFVVPESGEYQFFIRKPQNMSLQEIKKWQIKVNDDVSSSSAKIILQEDGWLNWGSLDLEKGTGEITVNMDAQKNLIDAKNWSSCDMQKISEQVPADEFTLLRKSLGEEIFCNQSEGWQDNTWYRLDGAVEEPNSPLTLFIAEEIVSYEDSKPVTNLELRKGFLFTKEQAKKFSIYIKSGADAANLRIFFGAANKPEKLEIEVSQIFAPSVILKKVNNPGLNPTPKIRFTKVNPTKYKITINEAKEPFELVFNESYHKNWKVFLAEGKREIAKDTHSLVNGYANSWYVTRKDIGARENFELIVEFWPQRLFYWGILISLAALLGGGVYLIYDISHYPNQRNK